MALNSLQQAVKAYFADEISKKVLPMKLLKQLALTLFLGVSTMLAYAEYELDEASRGFSRAELDQMLAPIALYPDSVLTHILIAATYPLEVVMADRWSRRNSNIKPEKAIELVENENWDPSVKALVSFPEILKRMSENLDWTQRVGDAFLDDEALVMDVIQGLRQRAFEAGSLNDMQYAKAFREDKVIIIEPSVERVVYVPYYDSRVIYGSWWWPSYPPVYWSNYYQPRHSHVSTRFYWGPRVYVGSGFYFSAFHWPSRHVVVVDTHRPRKSQSWGYTNRFVSRDQHATHWQHNPKHRGSVSYRSKQVKQRYSPNRSKKAETFRPHDRDKNPKRLPWTNTDKHKEDNSKMNYKKERSAQNKSQRERDNTFEGRVRDNKQAERSNKKYVPKQEYAPKQEQSRKEVYRARPPAQQDQQKSPKEIRWNNPPPPRYKARPSNEGEAKESTHNRIKDDGKSQSRYTREKYEQAEPSAPIDTEQRKTRGTKFQPRAERKSEKAQSSKKHFRRHEDDDKKRDRGSYR